MPGRTFKEVVMRSDSSFNSRNQRRENGFKRHLRSRIIEARRWMGHPNLSNRNKEDIISPVLGDKIMVFTILS